MFHLIVVKQNNNTLIFKDQLPFFKAGGGQPNDKVFITINGKERIPIKAYSDYELETAKEIKITEFPCQITAKIDLEYRKAVMRAHTCQHLISAILFQKYNNKTLKAVMNDDQVHLFLERPIPISEISNVIKIGFEHIICPIKITSHIIKNGDTKDQNGEVINIDNIRGGFPEDKEFVRLVAIGDFDLNTCGGTHLSSTAEIIAISIISSKKNDLQLFTGKKALNFQADQNQELITLSKAVQKPIVDSIPTSIKLITQLNEQNKDMYLNLNKSLLTFFAILKEKIHEAYNQRIEFNFTNIDNSEKNTKLLYWRCWSRNKRINLLLECKVERKLLLDSLNLLEHDSLNFIIIVLIENSTLLINVTHPSETTNANSIVNNLKEKFGGKGGGSKKIAQLILAGTDNQFNQIYQFLNEENLD